MSRVASVAHFVLAWLPIWGLYALMIGPANPIHPTGSMSVAAGTALRSISVAALLGVLVKRLTLRVHWPPPYRPSFAIIHVVAAAAYAASWFGIAATVENLIRPGALHGYRSMLVPNMVLGVWLYVMIAGTSYATRATQRAARAEAEAVRSQLAALRGQLNPHFLFNALHTVVQLIPQRPEVASQAAQQVADLLRTAIEEDRDVVTLADEVDFVTRYLEVEHLRFGERLRVQIDVSDDALRAELPSFALQALVENAVRHGAAPRIAPTTIGVTGLLDRESLLLTVSDDGAGAASLDNGNGTGLRRLRERLDALYGNRARLDLVTSPGNGLTATLSIPTGEA